MNDAEFEAIVNRIQGEVFQEARDALGDKGFDRWRSPKFCGVLEGADSHAKLKGECGDTMQMYIKVSNNHINEVRYMTDGCSSSSIAGSFTAEIAIGKSFEAVLDLRGDDVLKKIGEFPEEEEHCAHLAVRTLQEALNSYIIKEVRNTSSGKR